MIEHIGSELEVDAYGQEASLFARLLLDDLDSWRPLAVLAEGATLLDPNAVVVDNAGRGWPRSSALEALSSFLAQFIAQGGVQLVVLDDLDTRDSAYLDESLIGYDKNRVLRSFTVRESAEVDAAIDFFKIASSHRTVAVCTDPACPVSITMGTELSDQDVAQLVDSATHILVSAYDGEAIVVATK